MDEEDKFLPNRKTWTNKCERRYTPYLRSYNSDKVDELINRYFNAFHNSNSEMLFEQVARFLKGKNKCQSPQVSFKTRQLKVNDES